MAEIGQEWSCLFAVRAAVQQCDGDKSDAYA